LAPITAAEPITVPAPISTFGPITARIDDHAVFQMRRRIDDGGRCDAVIAEPGLRAKGIAVELPRDLDEFAERLRRAQNRNMGGNAGLEPGADQTGARLRRSELVGVFQVIEERQMHRAGFFKRSQPPDLLAAARRIDQSRIRQRGEFGQRQARRLFGDCRLRHSTHRGLAGH
jgi:hypothetical protein